MEIVPYEAGMAGPLAAAFSRQVRRVPHCCPASAEAFAAAVARTAGHANSNKPLRDKAALVAMERSDVLGFVDTAVGSPKEGAQPRECGVIPMFWYEPGRRAAGQALLAAAEDLLRRRGVSAVQAFPQEYQYDIYHWHPAYLSDHLTHVGALLVFNGYRRTRGEVFLDWPDFEPIPMNPCEVPVQIEVEWTPGRGERPDLEVHASCDGEQAGVCRCDSCGEPGRPPEMQDWFMTSWLGIEPACRGRGLGMHLLRRALVEMRAAGYRHAAISTSLDNHRAFVFYTNFGYHFADWTYGLARVLPDGG